MKRPDTRAKGFGERLRRERELRGISLDDICATTKIGTRLLRALEEEQFDLLPGGIFNKGYVRAYARYFGIDEEQAVADYLKAAHEAPPDVRLIAHQNSSMHAIRAHCQQRLLPRRLSADSGSHPAASDRRRGGRLAAVSAATEGKSGAGTSCRSGTTEFGGQNDRFQFERQFRFRASRSWTFWITLRAD